MKKMNLTISAPETILQKFVSTVNAYKPSLGSSCSKVIVGVAGITLLSLGVWFLPRLRRPSLIDLTKRAIQSIKSQEPVLPHQDRSIDSSALPLDRVEVVLPESAQNAYDLGEALFPLHRYITSQYLSLPWPNQMKNIVVLTVSMEGRGDISAAAKAIDVMQKISHRLNFDWVVLRYSSDRSHPIQFLHCNDPSRVSVRYEDSLPSEKTPADFLLIGPVQIGRANSFVEEKFVLRKIEGPIFGFKENAGALRTFFSIDIDAKNLHSELFPSQSGAGIGYLPMGLQIGSGIFIDQSLIKAPLSRGYCCPSYLLKIEEASLRKDILEAMNIFDGRSQPDYEQHSFNFGYAHRATSWGKFIDCVAIHEHHKHVVIVLNQGDNVAYSSIEEFKANIFTSERLAFLKQKGYGTVIFKGKGNTAALLQKHESSTLGRRLIVITRSSFVPSDMKYMQLAAERLLATGDNSAIEAWCARCKLYLYEDVANMGCKWRFLQQQVDLAQIISPSLSKLLALFGGDQRLPEPFLNQTLDKKKMTELEELLNDPQLSDATLRFCDHIISHYAFPAILEGSLKRAAWHYLIPELAQIEAEAIHDEFYTRFISYMKNPTASEKRFLVKTIPELGRQVHQVVRQHYQDEKISV